MRARGAALALLAAGVLVGTSACTYITPQATMTITDITEGVNATVGAIDVRNALVLSEDGDTGSFLVNLLNTSDKGVNVRVQYQDADGAKMTELVFVNPGKLTSLGGPGGQQLVFRNMDTAAGDLLPVFIQYDKVPGAQLQVPVLDESIDYFAGLLPSPSPSESK
ncbi:MAG TPA: hypothetical protein VIQ26_02990 [Microbacteriaceae bacterium]